MSCNSTVITVIGALASILLGFLLGKGKKSTASIIVPPVSPRGMIIYAVAHEDDDDFHPMHQCLDHLIVGTGSSETDITLRFSDGSVLAFDLKDGSLHVEYREEK